MTEDVRDYRCMSSGECCANWRIDIEEPIYKKLLEYYNAHSNPSASNQLFDVIDEDGVKKYTIHHYKGHCPFLESNKLCHIHRKLGHATKPYACRQFPNNIFPTPYGIIATLSYACPSCARFLLDGRTFRILSVKNTTPAMKMPEFHVDKNKIISWDGYKLFEKNIIDILSESEQGLEIRLMRVGAYIEHLSNLDTNNEILEPLHIATLDETISIGGGFQSLDNRFSQKKVMLSQQLKVLHALLILWKTVFMSKLLSDEITLLLDELHFNATSPVSSPALVYGKGIREYIHTLPKRYEKALTKFILSKIYSKKPFYEESIKKGYYTLITVLAIHRLHLLAMSLKKKGLPDDADFLKSIQFIERYFMHSPHLTPTWNKVDRAHLFDNPDYVYLMIRTQH